MYYFIRANGDTLHNNPAKASYYVLGEPPVYPKTRFNGLKYCFQHNIVRIGWPDTGDLREKSKTGALADGYNLESLKPHVQNYLKTFVAISKGSVILVPDKDNSGDVYIAETITAQPYDYYHAVPADPYEHAHRLKVKWDRDKNGQPIRYRAEELNIGTKGGFWTRAFHALDETKSGREAMPFIKTARDSRR